MGCHGNSETLNFGMPSLTFFFTGKCLAARFPYAFSGSISIQTIAAFGTAVNQSFVYLFYLSHVWLQIVHCLYRLEGKVRGEKTKPFKPENFNVLYKQFLDELDSELNADNGFGEYLVGIFEEGTGKNQLTRPSFVIR